MLGLIRRTFGSKDPVAIKAAFNASVRPILEYTCPVWNPYLVKHIHSIESIQYRATRLICESDKSYSERLTELNWSTLELRRKYSTGHGHCSTTRVFHAWKSAILNANSMRKTRVKHSCKKIHAKIHKKIHAN